ncbi:hypothetical protein EJB05_31682 [Eragrostis curvula]|uniref:Uncharacterized protein n=1 Tax=Eragrostis curvula TaxID=38414 RepID=A0A5J9UFA3_9POAL|nr:hypothetical protein EJB05_31682 [Eragrostis curvula]
MGSDVHERLLKTCVRRLALLDTPSGFALFNIEDKVFRRRDAIWAWLTDVNEARSLARVIEYVKVEDKSVTTQKDGPGEERSRLIKKYCRSGSGKEFYVKDEKLRHVIYSNLKIKCSDDAYVIGEVMWGLSNVMYDLVFEERHRLDPGFQNIEPCLGLQKCIKIFKLSQIAINQEFILHAAGLYRCHTMLRMTQKDLRNACNRHVPAVGVLIPDDDKTNLYAHVVAKILTPGVLPDWDFTQKCDGSMAQELKEIDAAAETAREKVGYEMYHFMHATFMNLNSLPAIIKKARKFLNSLPRCSVDQRSHMEKISLSDSVTESSYVMGSSQDTYNANEAISKKPRIDDFSNEMICS